MRRVHCGNCRIPLQDDDVVVLNWLNTLTHMNCYQQPTEKITDIGTYKQIINKYWFFEEVRN